MNMDSSCVDTEGWKEAIDGIVIHQQNPFTKKYPVDIPDLLYDKVKEVMVSYTFVIVMYEEKYDALHSNLNAVKLLVKKIGLDAVLPNGRIYQNVLLPFRIQINYQCIKFWDTFHAVSLTKRRRRYELVQTQRWSLKGVLEILFRLYTSCVNEIKEMDADLELIQSIKEYISAYSDLG